MHVTFRRVGNAEGATASAIASALVQGLGMTPPPSWTALDPRQALTVGTRTLFADFARDMPLMPVGVASDLARRFIESLGPDASFFTNGTLALKHGGKWTPLTRAAFDTGLIGVSSARAGLLWVEDEDQAG